MIEPSKYLNIFLDEGRDLVGSLERAIVQLERNPSDFGAMSDALRVAHTLKGSSRMVGLPGLSSGAHGIENMLEKVGSEETSEATGDIALILDVIDRMKTVFDAIERGETQDLTDLHPVLIQEEEDSSGGIVNDLETGEMPLRVKKKAGEAPEGADKFAIDQLATGIRTRKSQGLRVRLDRMENLTHLVESATVTSKKLSATLSELKSSSPLITSSPLFAEISEELHKLDNFVNQTRNAVLELRMVALADLFGAFPRMVRDLAEQLGKEVELFVEGENVELDRNLLEELQGPLTHLLRNAIDHGIEKPEERIVASKQRTGRLWLRAFYKPGVVVIEVEDDGGGIDTDQLRLTAIQKGIMQQAELAEMEDSETYYLLLRPGFTTRMAASDVSGRGIGLDVVNSSMERLQGTLSISSARGKYTKFSITLPQSVSSTRALVVGVEGMTAAIPTLFVEKCVKASARRLISRGGLLPFMDERLHVVSLASLLGFSAEPPSGDVDVVIMSFRDTRMALAVGSIIGEEELLIKDLGNHLADEVATVLGVTITDKGQVAPILDVRHLHERWPGLEFSCRLPAPRLKASLKALVVDDALTSRHVVSSILEEMGHEVTQARDGAEGWGLLEDLDFDLVVTDMEMPEVDGIELVRRIRRTERLLALPVIMMSVKSGEADVARAYGVGVSSFVPKERLNGSLLGRTLRNLFPEA